VKRNRNMPIIYGAKGVVRLEIQPEFMGELPFQYQGCYTKVTKVWTTKHRTWFVDVRDLPGLKDKRYLFGMDEKSEEIKAKQKKKEVVEISEPEIMIEEVE